MTDNDIIKALECCEKAKTRDDCKKLGCPACEEKGYGCVYFNRTDEEDEWACFAEIGKDLVDLINRQKAEIEEKSNKLRDVLPIVAELKAETITEFAERLKAELVVSQFECDGFLYDVYDVEETCDKIDQIAKEMKGEQ